MQSKHASSSGLTVWHIVHGGKSTPLAVAPNSQPAEIDAAIKRLIGLSGTSIDYKLADGVSVVLSSALPTGIELHCHTHKDAPKERDGELSLIVTELTGETYQFTFPDFDSCTVEEFKNMIQGKSGIPVDQQRLIFAGSQWEDHRRLSEYGMTSGSNVHLVLKLRGC